MKPSMTDWMHAYTSSDHTWTNQKNKGLSVTLPQPAGESSLMKKVKNKTVFSFPPKVKQRPRMTRRGRVFTPTQTLEFEALVREGWTHGIIEGDISVTIYLTKEEFHVTVEQFTKDKEKTKLRGDIDNYAKSILDGLNGTAFVDDKFIRELIVIKS